MDEKYKLQLRLSCKQCKFNYEDFALVVHQRNRANINQTQITSIQSTVCQIIVMLKTLITTWSGIKPCIKNPPSSLHLL